MPGYDSAYRPGDNLFTASAIAFNVATGKMQWYHQYTPNDNRDYDETGVHMLIDTKVNGRDRKIVTHPGRNGFNYTFDRVTGEFLNAGQYVSKVTWTKGANPGDIPVEQPMRFELFINRKTANALGLKISNTMLVQATKVIE